MNQPPHPPQHPQNAQQQQQQPHIPPHIVVLADSSLALAAEWDQLVTEYLFPMLRALMHAPGGSKEPVKIRIAVVTYAASSVRPSPLVTKQFFAEPQILRDLQLDPHKLGIGQHPAAPHGLAALEGFVAAIELLDLIRECIPLKDGFPLHIFHLAAAHRDAAHAPRWNDAPALDGVAWDSLPGELRKRNIHLSTICVGKLAEFAELYKQATPEGDATHPWFPTRPAHQVLISGLSAHPNHPAQLTHPNQTNQHANQPNQPTQSTQPSQPTHPQPPQPPQPSQPQTQTQTPAVPVTGAPGASQAAPAPTGTGTGTPTHAKRTHELAQTERPQADVKRAKPSPEKSSPMVAPAVPPGPPSAPNSAPANALPSTTVPPSGPSASGSSATTAPPTTTASATTTTAPGPPSGPPPPGPTGPNGPAKPSAALPALPAGLSPQQFGRYRHLLEAKLHSIKAKLDALGRGEAAGEGEVEALKKQFEQTGRQLVAFSEFMKVHVARAGGGAVGGASGQGGGGEQAQAQGETSSGQTAPALTSSPALSNHPPPPQPPQQQDAPKPDTAQAQQQPKPTAPPAQFPMPPPNQVLNQSQTQNLNPNPNTLGHQRQRSMQDLQRGVGDGNNGGGNNGAGGGGVPGNPSPSLMNRMPSGPPNPNAHQQGLESQGGRRGWQGIFSWSGLDPNTQERKEVQTMVSAVFPDEARANQARPETWPANLTLHPTTDRAVSQLDLRAWLARYTPGLCTFQNVPQDARQNEVNFRSLISLLLAKNIYATASWSAPGGAHVTPNMLIFPTNTNILCGAVFPLTGIPELPKPTPQPPVPAGLPNLPNFTNQMRQQFARMTPEQRQNFMLVARQRQLLSQQQGQQQGQGFASPNMMSMQGAGIPLMGGMAGMAGKPGGGFPGAAGMAGVQPGLANMMQRFGLPPGTSAEQMQAFLQSNFGGGNSNQLP